jgi:hypothetical protein
MSTTPYLEQLGRQHGFTLDELEANRRGALHPGQLARGVRKGMVSIVVLATLGLLALGTGLVGAYAFYEGLGPDPSRVDVNAAYAIAGAGVFLGLVFFVCAGISVARRGARKAAFATGRIEVLEGALDKMHIIGGGTPSEYSFRVAGRSFPTLPAVWELLTQGANYRLYCVADQLLSFEPVVAEAVPAAVRQSAGSPCEKELESVRTDDPVARAEYDRDLAHLDRTRNIKPSRRGQ